MTTSRFRVRVPLLAALALSMSQASVGDTRVTHKIESEHTGRTQTIEIRLPRSYDDHPETEFPVLVVLDAESNLDHASSVSDFLAESGAIPDLVVVGVYAGVTRAQDYAFAPVQEELPAHGARFLDFVRLEALPLVEREYRAASLRLISGHSLGGAFVTAVLAQRPGLFSAYIAQSPYLPGEFGGAILDELGTQLADSARDSAFYYANLGDEPDLREAFTRLGGIVAEASSVRSHTELEPRETHMSTRLLGLYNGLKLYFEPDWLFDGNAGALPAHVASLSTAYGFEMMFAEGIFQEHIRRALAAGDTAAALSAAHLYVEQHAYSPVPHFLLAAARARSGDLQGARSAIQASAERYNADPRVQWQSLEPSIRAFSQQLGVSPMPD